MHTKPVFDEPGVDTFLQGGMPFLKLGPPFYTYSIDVETLWGGVWYLFFETQHGEHGEMWHSGAFVWQ